MQNIVGEFIRDYGFEPELALFMLQEQTEGLPVQEKEKVLSEIEKIINMSILQADEKENTIKKVKEILSL